MNNREEASVRQQYLGELFAALKTVLAEDPRLQEMVRMQEQDNRQVLLNMSSLLRMVEQEQSAPGSAGEPYRPKVVQGWMMHDGDGGTLAGVGDARESGLENDTGHGVDAAVRQSAAPLAAPEVPVQEPKRSNFFDRAFLKSLKISI